MATYGELSSFDYATGVETRVPIDNAWLRANTRQVVLSADLTTIAVGAIATISAQLSTLPLLDDTVETIAESVVMVFNIDGKSERLTLDGTGLVVFTVKPVTAGTYQITCESVPSNTLMIVAV